MCKMELIRAVTRGLLTRRRAALVFISKIVYIVGMNIEELKRLRATPPPLPERMEKIYERIREYAVFFESDNMIVTLQEDEKEELIKGGYTLEPYEAHDTRTVIIWE